MNEWTILHETATRLRVGSRARRDLDAIAVHLRALDGVQSARTNGVLGCLVVQHDGRVESRAAVLAALASAGTAERPRAAGAEAARSGDGVVDWTPGLLAASLPLLPADWRPAGALGVVATRIWSQRGRLVRDPPAVLLDAASLAALAVSGQPLVVSASVLLRLLSEGLSSRLVRQADTLLGHLLPQPASSYRVVSADMPQGEPRALVDIAPGDTLALEPGDIVPVDGCVASGEALLHPVAVTEAPRPVTPGTHVAAGERVLMGRFELRCESDVADSRLQRLRRQLEHTIGSRDPAGRLSQDTDRLLSLPLTGAALVLGLTGDRARAAAMLQADPQQGLDLAVPVAREAALVALARHGLVTSGLEAIERLAAARTLVLQDSGVLASGRWTVESIQVQKAVDVEQVRNWLAELAGTPAPALELAGLPDLLVRQWVRHGALHRHGAQEWHLAAALRLRRIWGLEIDDPGTPAKAPAPEAAPALRRVFAVVVGSRVIARVVLVSAWRDGAAQRLQALRGLGFERIAVFVEDDGSDAAPQPGGGWCGDDTIDVLADDTLARREWLATATHGGEPLVVLHTVLRDLVPPGSLSLTPTEADAGAHGVLLGEPLAGLLAARSVALAVHRRLRVQQSSAVAANALLMTASALSWLPPIATALLHHGFAMLLLLDSLRIENLETAPAAGSTASPTAVPNRSRRRRAARRSVSP